MGGRRSAINDLKSINTILKYSTRKDFDKLKDELALTDRQRTVFNMKYMQKKPIGFIADSLGFSTRTIDLELATIRKKIAKIL